MTTPIDKSQEEKDRSDFEKLWLDDGLVDFPYGTGGNKCSLASLSVTRRKEAAFVAFKYARQESRAEIEELKEDVNELIMLCDVVSGQGHIDNRDHMAIDEIKLKHGLK